ncbi:MAG: hypothetical protein KC421_28720, partial [Anaerolineales bacterium]|nr:hypothetical protein [Anaerolineales bacterium]
MRSLTLKLTLAFLLIGIVIVAMIGIFFSQQVRQSFDQFVLDRWQVDVIRRAQTYYEFNGGWDNFGTEPYIQFNDREEGG